MLEEALLQIQAKQKEIAELAKMIETERKKKLAGLHKEVGLATREELINALKALEKPARGARKAAVAKKPKGKRTRITQEVIDQVKALLESGKTGKEAAQTVGISVPSLQNIKKKLGMTRTSG